MVTKINMNPYFQTAKPIIYNHNSYTKEKLYKESLLLCREFFIYNNIDIPEITDKQHFLKLNATGYYDKYKQIIHINTSKCKNPELVFSQNYNFPGWRYDSTIVGVLGKQCGYHIDNIFDDVSQSKSWCSIYESSIFKKDESYSSDFSESARIFITNPGLLKRGRPQKFKFFTQVLNLRPLFDLPWDTVLQNCDSDSKESIKRWFLT